MRLVAGARDFKDVYSSYENTLMTPNISPSIPARRIYTNQPPHPQAYEISNLYEQDEELLRTVYCPLDIIQGFIDNAKENTLHDIETCAILAGREISKDSLIIDTLIFPEQKGYVDHCYMTDELSLFETQIQRKLMTIGWIHSHPTYDLFLSSVDLHNQLGYQLQLEEAIALVYSPISKVSQTKAFRLRNDSMETILDCQKEGFHEHIIQND